MSIRFSAGKNISRSEFGFIANVGYDDENNISDARLFGCSEERLKSEADIRIDTPPGMKPLPKGAIEFVDLKAVERTDTVLVYVRQPNPDGRLVPDSAATLVLSVAASGV